MRGKDEFVHIQEFIIQDINHTAKAYFQFIEGFLSVRVVGDCNDIQFDFDVYPETLKVFTHLYNEHVKECNSVANQKNNQYEDNTICYCSDNCRGIHLAYDNRI